jgi:hypothetical protein
LSQVDYVYVWADGIHVNIRLEENKLYLLVLIGVRATAARSWSRSSAPAPRSSTANSSNDQKINKQSRRQSRPWPDQDRSTGLDNCSAGRENR